MRRIVSYTSFLFVFFIPLMLQAQSLTALKQDSRLLRGSLRSGIDYYVMDSPVKSGIADFAIVQKDFVDPSTSKKSLAFLPHLGNRKPYEFFSSNGASYSRHGFIKYTGDATCFDIRNIRTANPAVVDTTLMALFDIAATSGGPQAIVVCGDVNSKEVVEKMKLFSILLDTRNQEESEPEYEWKPTDSLAVRLSSNGSDDVAAIHLKYRAPRPARESLNTIVPVVSELLARELGVVAEQRLRYAFYSENIPIGGVKFHYSDAASGPGDIVYSMCVYTSASRLDDAVAAIGSALGSIDAHGADVSEFSMAKRRIEMKILSDKGHATMTSGDADRCIADFLYGTGVPLAGTVSDFIVRRNISVDRDLELFNSFAKALLSPDMNVSMRADVPCADDVDPSSLRRIFKKAWADADVPPAVTVSGDALRKSGSKVKLKSAIADPLSGGQLWTFSNGMKVIYKNMPGSGSFHFAFMINGGYAEIPSFKSGEEIYASDMMGLYNVSGISAFDFSNMLASRGVSMNYSVSLTDMRLSGLAPSSELEFLLRALLSIAEDSRMDKDALEQYAKEAVLLKDMEGLFPRSLRSVSDSLLFPGRRTVSPQPQELLTASFQKRMDEYLKHQFSKCADGIMVIIGDVPEEVAKKELCRHLGDFKVQKKYAQRITSRDYPIAGVSRRSILANSGVTGGAELGAYISVCVPLDFTIEHYAASEVALKIVEEKLSSFLADCGFYFSLEHKMEFVPTEQLRLWLAVRPCDESGLPEGISPKPDYDALAEGVIKLLSELAEYKPDSVKLKEFKLTAASLYGDAITYPEALLNAVLIRYADGKNVVTNYKSALSSVLEPAVSEALRQIAQAPKVSYTIK